ncbi:hypothetical protein Cst_c25390 [Thermoclostridium stercorarium subsp. stercorarium DSM 8532]|jgi:hypothetical protein|uniref:Uncharacterized protein n=3 Tax=Thermoclostridium stercorarium TaxID=1510 RepID=L7VSY7_THES1|nr:hypothetical protein [Thermoclostridium stercorarium]AGC69496.1 hypothetical protein Cst_c25390 [Thermoclostridium stercorarium subsp. stercorarium DSM 8532]AGI40449.1 hypothetical protein Clst_2429 [Thermoclostridium stercorarium subsp. stercorarium DSM 8532]ANW99736.1 hypothetical protein CSTERTH_12165 [Thermoclostridium stercorarium subsp. thermolacticum DSM 2910]ANX02362.1 hypothetical protein CSTERLE_12655 [Thermoclostridium stercorarium subsp. leptospartum DSM 9219]UZQ85441.1 hypothet
MSGSSELLNIPLPTEKDNIKYPQVPSVSDDYHGNLPDIKGLLKKIQLDDVLLLGLIILIASDDDCDNFLLALLIFIFLAGLDKLFPF